MGIGWGRILVGVGRDERKDDAWLTQYDMTIITGLEVHIHSESSFSRPHNEKYCFCSSSAYPAIVFRKPIPVMLFVINAHSLQAPVGVDRVSNARSVAFRSQRRTNS